MSHRYRPQILAIPGMSLAPLYLPGRLGLSFEFFPPKTPAAEEALFESAEQLGAFRPDFVTCTYGAGGSTQTKTLDVCQGLKRRLGVPVASHLTCVGSTVDQLRQYVREAKTRGVDHIVALRGDPPKGETSFTPVAGGFSYANELVAFLRQEFPELGLIVGGYPEKHQEAPSMDVDLANLKRKVDAGADVVVTQLFYDNADFFRFRDQCDALGIQAPIVPGILPVTNFAQIQRIASLCGARLPQSFVDRMTERDDPEWQFQVGVEFATQQVAELLDAGVPGMHFYVLNKSPATSAVLKAVDWATAPA